jgi:CBS domain containing-hemolysin-like protein
MNTIIFHLFVILGLVLANAFFVAAEFALVRVRRTRIDELIGEGNATAKVVKQAIDHLDDYISATQVGITLASLALGAIGEPFLTHQIFEPLFRQFLPLIEARAESLAQGVGIGAAFFLITFLHVVLGELLPKSLALQFPEKMSLYIARPMKLFAYLFRPLIWLLNGASNRVMRLFGIKPVDAHSLALSEEELLMLLSESKKAGVVSEDEQKMLQRVFKFHDKTVREIMKPRPDIAALDLRAKEEEIKAVFEEGYSRLPVYSGSLNNIKGIVYVKDLIYTLQDPKLIKLIDLVRECIFVPESKAVPELLREFQKNKMHMAIVVDEFGDTAGLVTLEDVIEEIVGEIQDEYDSEVAEIERAKDGTFVFDGKTGIDRLREIFSNYELPDGSFETVAGLVFHLAGRVPREADVVRFKDLSFRVVKREGRRLRKIAVRRETGVEAQKSASRDTDTRAKEISVAAENSASASDEGVSPTARYQAIVRNGPDSDDPSATPEEIRPSNHASKS